VARAAGRTDIAERHARRAQGYRLLWDEATRTMRGRDSQGRWRTPFDPDRATSPMNNPGDYTEANAWQYTPTPGLHDPAGLAALMGGPAGLERWLDDFFSRTSAAAGADKHLGQEALIGQYAHGNEPSHHIAWLYAWTPAPWKGQAMVHRIAKQFYGDGPDGITGNDDCGQMSAWYVLATLGLYPVVPASGEMVLGRPRVREARLQRPGAKALVIRADPPPEPSNRGGPRGPGHWASSATLDGRALDPRALRHADLAGGGRLQIGWARVP
jgi:predicted alpha-1,2-mannosidase